jgi:hypothetical protein
MGIPLPILFNLVLIPFFFSSLKTGTGDISSTQKVKFSMCLIKHHAWEAE